MAEASGTKPPEQSLLTRRALMRRTAGAVGALFGVRKIAGQTDTRAQESVAPTPTPDVPKMREKIQTKHDIILSVSPDFPYDWTPNGLRVLDATLEVFPDHMYKTDSEGRTLNLQLSQGRSHCCTYEKQEKVLSYAAAAQDAYSMPPELAHELTHDKTVRVTPTEGGYSVKNVYSDEVQGILGEDFYQFSANTTPVLQQKMTEYRGDEHIPLQNFFRAIEYGLGNMDEFQASLSEGYVQGKDLFFTVFGILLPEKPQITEGLYNFIKDKVFLGTEFERPVSEMVNEKLLAARK